jgi:hypothetical protein
MAIAGTIERYVKDHPRAADTPEGIRCWWFATERQEPSLPEVERALDYLVGAKLLTRIVLVDGTIIYARESRNRDR